LVYWHAVDVDDRRALAQEIEVERGDRLVVPLVPRRASFQDANSVLSDLVRLVDESRETFERIGDLRECLRRGERLVLIVLARRSLEVPQLASPVAMPIWLPEVGGLELPVRIRDLGRSALCALGVPEAHVDGIAHSLYRVETALVGRLSATLALSQNELMALLSRVAPATQTKPGPYLEVCRAFLARVQNPRGYRPSPRDESSLLGGLLRVVTSHSPDKWPATAEALCTALRCDELGPPPRGSLPGVLLRPSAGARGTPQVLQNLMVTAYLAYEYLNCAMHADQYPSFPVGLVLPVARDLRESLLGFALWIQQAESTPIT